ncbi:hypothetical protein ABZ299_04075 [Streptomyces sp. NPDC006184]|uniref:hypothetical protein n=1 Tax=Streptomyces sp. NPDC006184 TaxID=3155455 RepID=UPI0033B01827
MSSAAGLPCAAGKADRANRRRSWDARDPEGGRGRARRSDRMRGRRRFRERGGDDPLRLVGVEERVKKIDHGTTLFEKKHPKVSVKTYFQTYESFWKKCRTQATGGNPPDVFQSGCHFPAEVRQTRNSPRSSVVGQGGYLSLDQF